MLTRSAVLRTIRRAPDCSSRKASASVMETPQTVMAGVASVSFSSWIQSRTARMPKPLSRITRSGDLANTHCRAASSELRTSVNSRSGASASRFLKPSAVIAWVSHTATVFFELFSVICLPERDPGPALAGIANLAWLIGDDVRLFSYGREIRLSCYHQLQPI